MAFYGYNGDESAPHYSSPYHLGEHIPIPIDYYKHDYSQSTYSDPINNTSSCNYYHYSVNQSELIYNYSQPNYLQYDPPPPYQGYFPSQTKFTVSYSNVELNVPEFQEYDPTPYDGGYDQAITYGNPLPPSDLICYPRSLPQSDAPPLENFSFDSIPSPYGKDQHSIPTGTNSTDSKTENHSDAENGDKIIDDGKDVGPIDAIPIVEQSDVIESVDYPNYGRGIDFPQIPYGSGLETVDLCESLFGYWPCLAKKAQQQRNYCQFCDQDRRIDPWKSAADYLFGSPVPYDYDNYHQQHQSDQISWLQ